MRGLEAILSAVLIGVCSLAAGSASAQKQYDVGVTDTEIKIGNTSPYSGPVSAYGAIGKAEAAYFTMINDNGGINGRKINFISYDDAYSPAKTVEQVRKLVENDEVFLVFSNVGTAPGVAVRKYLNQKQVPQLFIASGASGFGDEKNFPWTMGLTPTYESEGRIYGKYILKNLPAGKIAVLYQNDDSGKDYLKGLKQSLGDKGSMIVGEASFEPTEPTIDSQIVKLKASGADILLIAAIGKFSAQAIRRSSEIGWNGTRIVCSAGATLGGALKPAGLQNSQNLLSVDYRKDVSSAKYQNDPGVMEFLAFMEKYLPGADKTDSSYVSGYLQAVALTQVLKQSGDNLTRKNVMKEAANFKGFKIGMLIDGITLNTSPTDYYPVEQYQMRRFQGESWEAFGPIIDGHEAN